MDLLKAELERKRRAVAAGSSGGGGTGDRRGRKKRYLTAAERRRREEEEEDDDDEREERSRRERRRKRKRKKDEEDEEGKEEEDLTTLLTRRYDPAAERRKASEVANAAASGGADGEERVASEEAGGSKENGDSKVGGRGGAGGGVEIPESLRKLSPEEVTHALRGYGLPVRLFGETTTTDADGAIDDSARLRRLLVATEGREAAMLGETEKDEFLLDSAHRSRNVFLKQDAHHDDDDDGGGGDGDGKGPAAKDVGTAALTEEELRDKPKRIYRYFKSLLRQWEEDLARRPDAEKRTAAGRNETKTLKQCKDYIRPLFKMCRSRELEEDLQSHLFKIVTYCEEGEFVKAHDSYIDMAIGRAAWPIGVTMVGIHARSGRAKIESANVAHVMNSELHRKYLTSVKRLMSYAQRKRPDVDPSKKVRNV